MIRERPRDVARHHLVVPCLESPVVSGTHNAGQHGWVAWIFPRRIFAPLHEVANGGRGCVAAQAR